MENLENELTIDYLKSLPKLYEKYFNFTPYQIKHDKRNVISCSLFKSSDYDFENKYLTRFYALLKYIETNFPNHGVMLFTTEELKDYFKDYDINIYVNEFNKGLIHTFSRFLAIDYDIDLMMCIDVDEVNMNLHKNFKNESARILKVGKYDYYVDDEKTAKKYSSIMAGIFQIKKGDITFKMKDIIPRFLYHQENNFKNEKQTLYNKPVGEHKKGFGNIPFIYGCDERFLAKVLYFHLVKKGQLVTYISNTNNYENKLDFAYCKKYNNKIINF
jgi:hypothetical protein